MKRAELIELYHEVQDIADERDRLGEFDANAKTINAILAVLMRLIEHEIEPGEKK